MLRIHATLVLPLCLLGCKKADPPTCEETEDFACFTGVFSGLLGARLDGVEVCAVDLPDIPCVRSDDDGGWQMPGLPLDIDVLITATYEDAVPTVFPQHTSMDWYDWYKVMVPRSIMNQHANRLDVELDDSRGHLLFLAWEGLNLDGDNTPNVAGVVATLDPQVEPFYANGLGLAASDLTETSGSGSGGALNLEPGDHALRLSAPGGDCTEHSFHFLATDGAVPVPIVAGFATAIDVICPP
ncbi:MAG: hypothetical protein KC912_22895 [Proteobacteria bacterium]|nr:hypothetical protein [Pseudomonadota bacterium]